MARLKNQSVPCVDIRECDYVKLLEDHMVLRALKIAGIEKHPIYKAAWSIIDDGRIEIHMKPIKKYYR